MGLAEEVGLADPTPLARGLSPADSGAGLPLHQGCALEGRFTRDLGRGSGLEIAEGWGKRERESGRVSPTP